MSPRAKRGRPSKAKTKKKAEEVKEQRRWLVDMVKSTYKMFSAGRDFFVSAAGVITAIVALSGSCNNFKRADTSYTALAGKINQVLTRLETLEKTHNIVVMNDSKSWSERMMDARPKDNNMGMGMAMATSIPEAKAVMAAPAPAPAPVEPPLPLKLDELMVQQEQRLYAKQPAM